MKDLFTRYTNDVIATTALGIGCDSLKNPNNDFYTMGKLFTSFSGLLQLKFLGYSLSPTLMKVTLNLCNKRKKKNININISREKCSRRPELEPWISWFPCNVLLMNHPNKHLTLLDDLAVITVIYVYAVELNVVTQFGVLI